MKVKTLIKLLELCDPEQIVLVNLGSEEDAEYRRKCAKAELAHGDCLNYMKIDDVVMYKNEDDEEDDTLCMMINLEQTNYLDEAFGNALKEFEEKYQER